MNRTSSYRQAWDGIRRTFSQRQAEDGMNRTSSYRQAWDGIWRTFSQRQAKDGMRKISSPFPLPSSLAVTGDNCAKTTARIWMKSNKMMIKVYSANVQRFTCLLY
jgi:hypothetical protein